MKPAVSTEVAIMWWLFELIGHISAMINEHGVLVG
jgi:hypothetical protein